MDEGSGRSPWDGVVSALLRAFLDSPEGIPEYWGDVVRSQSDAERLGRELPVVFIWGERASKKKCVVRVSVSGAKLKEFVLRFVPEKHWGFGEIFDEFFAAVETACTRSVVAAMEELGMPASEVFGRSASQWYAAREANGHECES